MRPLINEARFNRLLTRAALLPLLLMAALSGLLIWQISHLLRAFEWEGHTDAVIAQANLSQKLLLDMETGKRGYLLSGAPKFLQPYREARNRIGPALDNLASLVADNQPQENRARSIRTLSSQWDADAQATITGAGVITPATQRRFSDDRGKHLMDAMRGQFDGLISEETRLRSAREAATSRSARGVIATALAAALAGGLLLGLSARRHLMELAAEYAGATATARRQAQTIQESEERLRLTIDTALDAVINADSDGVITGWNAQAEIIFGRTSAEVIGQALDKTIIPEVYRDAHRNGLARYLKTGEGKVLNARIEITALRPERDRIPGRAGYRPGAFPTAPSPLAPSSATSRRAKRPRASAPGWATTTGSCWSLPVTGCTASGWTATALFSIVPPRECWASRRARRWAITCMN